MKKYLLVTTAIFLVSSGMTHATPVLSAPENWNATASPGWTLADAPTSDPAVNVGLAFSPGVGNAVTVTFPNGGYAPAAQLGATGANFTGDFSGLDLGNGSLVTFTLTSLDVAPNSSVGLSLYFKTASDFWYSSYVITPSGLLNTPVTYSYTINTASQWFRYTGSQDFASAFGAVTEFGFELTGGNLGAQQRYTFGDVTFVAAVPEPETIWMIVMVLASLGITFRSRLSEVVGQVLARIKA